MSNIKKHNLIKRKVKKLLKDSGIDFLTFIQDDNNAEINLNQIIEYLGINLVNHEFSNDISGVYYKDVEKFHIGVNSEHPETRKRFTIAHEIGHHILHDNHLHYDGENMAETTYFRATKLTSAEETEANYFAAELLMPEELIEKCIANGVTYVGELATCFNVSEQAMRHRLINLGYL